MKVVVTGGTGFIGGALVRKLSELGHDVVAPIRGSTPSNLQGVKWCPAFPFGDLGEMSTLLTGADAVIHCAAYAHQTRITGEREAEIFQRVNVELTKALYRQAGQAGVEQFVFLSSIGSIASSSENTITESTEPDLTDDYGRSKRRAEAELKNLRTESSTSLTIVRPTLVYGVNNPGNMARLSRLIDTGLPLPFGKIRARRTFTYLDNVCDAIMHTLGNGRAFDQEFIVCDDETVTLTELLQLIAEAKRAKLRILPVSHTMLTLLGRIGDVLEVVTGRSIGIDSYSVSRLTNSLPCSNQKIRSLLDWQPPYSLAQGIASTFNE